MEVIFQDCSQHQSNLMREDIACVLDGAQALGLRYAERLIQVLIISNAGIIICAKRRNVVVLSVQLVLTVSEAHLLRLVLTRLYHLHAQIVLMCSSAIWVKGSLADSNIFALDWADEWIEGESCYGK